MAKKEIREQKPTVVTYYVEQINGTNAEILARLNEIGQYGWTVILFTGDFTNSPVWFVGDENSVPPALDGRTET